MILRHLLLRLVRLLSLTFVLALPAGAEGLSALARLDAARSSVAMTGEGLAVTLTISQPVPWRLRFLEGPPRLVIDTREVDWTGATAIVRVAPVIDSEFPLDQAAAAHARLESSAHIGKIVLTVA